jgi:hypothetical protein
MAGVCTGHWLSFYKAKDPTGSFALFFHVLLAPCRGGVMSSLSKETVYGAINWGLMLLGIVGAVIYFSGAFQSPTQEGRKLSQEQPRSVAPQEQPKINSTLPQEQQKIAAVAAPVKSPSQASLPTTTPNAQTAAAINSQTAAATNRMSTARSIAPRPQAKDAPLMGNQHPPYPVPLESNDPNAF